MTNLVTSSISSARNARSASKALSPSPPSSVPPLPSPPPPPPPLPVIDMEFAMKQALDDAEFLSELLDELLGDSCLHIKKIEDSLCRNDHRVRFWWFESSRRVDFSWVQKLQRTAHTIKGVASNLGLKALALAAADVDDLAKELRSGKLDRV
jgi:HPt (histidine-containing phosphotransfer) domain-containing protein